MKVIYGSHVNTDLPDGTSPEDIMNILKESYSELSNGQYAITTENGVQTMRITLRSGSKA